LVFAVLAGHYRKEFAMRIIAGIAFIAAGCILLNAASQDKPQDKPTIVRVPPSRTSPASGPEMFDTYCAVCHGKAGRGDGPAAAALKARPTDLTQLARKNDGKFPALRVQQSITQDVNIGAHGDREMPVWGPVFKSIEPGDSLWRLRAKNLTEYIQSIQAQ
jgi:mono/diheme cytochrome c family protein